VSSADNLNAGLAAIEFAFPERTHFQLLAFLALLSKWNRTYNLTAIRDPEAMVTQHLLDSLAVLPNIQQLVLATRRLNSDQSFRLADVGSGAGLPGVPLALACPLWNVCLIETVDKKSAFQRQVKAELKLNNVTVMNTRVEQVAAASFDAVISRAFADLVDFVNLAGHLIVPDGYLLAMKGTTPNEEIARLPDAWRVEANMPIAVPGLDAQRHLVVLRKV
jgi:16S rRNA (guanine527-N7)-methyltransferase